jgi:hypothetical protein
MQYCYSRAKGTHSRSNSNPTPTPPMVDEVCVTLLAYILLPVQHAAATASPASQFMHNIHIAQARLPAAAHSPFADAAAPTLPGSLCSVGVFSTHNCLPCCCAAHMPQEMHTHWSLDATTSHTWHTPILAAGSATDTPTLQALTTSIAEAADVRPSLKTAVHARPKLCTGMRCTKTCNHAHACGAHAQG